MTATISICIPCYNSERFIRTTIESALAQTTPADEIIISDDRSPDRSFEIVKEYADLPRVHVMRPPQRLSLGGHYRFLLEQASSDFICFLSSDDALMPDFVERILQQLDGESDIGMIAGACLECDCKLTPLRIRGGGLPRVALTRPNGFHRFKQGNSYTISVSALSRRILMEWPPLPAKAGLATDWYWALVLGASSTVKFVREPLGYYRIHDANAAHNNEDAWLTAITEMLQFLRARIDPQLGDELAAPQQRIATYREERQLGLSAPSKATGLSVSVKNLVKTLIALRYRALSKPIRFAERGISLALQHLSAHIDVR